MIGIIADSTFTGHPIVLVYLVFPCINNGRRCITKVESRAVSIERFAGFHRQSLKRLEARNDKGRLHIATHHYHIIKLTALQVAHRLYLGTNPRDAGIGNHKRRVGIMEIIRHLAGGFAQKHSFLREACLALVQ